MRVILILATVISGFRAAWLWLKASQVEIKGTPPENISISDVPELHIMKTQTDIFLIEGTIQEASDLNKKAALWTAVSVLFSALASLLTLK